MQVRFLPGAPRCLAHNSCATFMGMPEGVPKTDKKEGEPQVTPELQLGRIASEFAHSKRYTEAFELVKRSGSGIHKNLDTLLEIYREGPSELRESAGDTFVQYVADQERFGILMNIYRSIQSLRNGPVSEELGEAVASRMHVLDPSWDESSEEPKNKEIRYEEQKGREVPVEDLTDPEDCLRLWAAVNRTEKQKYLNRYLELGGSVNDVRYLKGRLDNIRAGIERSNDGKELISRLSEQLGPTEFRKWIRKHTQDKIKRKKDEVEYFTPRGFLRMALAAYIACSSDELDMDDWSYISERAVQIDDGDLQRICFEYLGRVQRDEHAQRVFSLLVAHGAAGKEIKISTPKSMVNPVYDPTGRVPVSRAAAQAAGIWAQDVLK